jgi:hypothetical protein
MAGSSVLSGKVKKSKTSDGIVAIASLSGTAGVDLAKLARCSPTLTSSCFDIGAVSAMLVDSLLAAGELTAR